MRRLVSAPNLALATLWADMLTHGGIDATVRVVEPLGAHTLVTADVDGKLFRAVLDSTTEAKTGDRLSLKPKPDRVRWFDPETSAALH